METPSFGKLYFHNPFSVRPPTRWRPLVRTWDALALTALSLGILLLPHFEGFRTFLLLFASDVSDGEDELLIDEAVADGRRIHSGTFSGPI